jgi:hypothetical protein
VRCRGGSTDADGALGREDIDAGTLASGASTKAGEPGEALHRKPLDARRPAPPCGYLRGLFFSASGDLMSYDNDRIEMFQQAASYVDRILRGEKPGNLPLQTPTKYKTVINLKTAKAHFLAVPDLLLARADEIIE